MFFARVDPGFLLSGGSARIRSSHFHPNGQIVDLGLSELLVLGRHLQVGIGVTNRLDQQAFFGIAGNDGRAVVASLEKMIAAVEPEAALDFVSLLAVALEAVV